MSEGASHSRRTKPGYEKPAKESSSSLPPSVIHLISGGIAGCVAKSSIAPFDRVKILFQINHPKYAYTGVFSTLSNIAKTEGFSQLWRGNTATVARVFPYAAIQFMSYEKYKQWLLPEKQTVHPIIHLCCGSLAGATATTFTYPLDLVRARLASEVQTRTYRHIFHGLAEIYRKEGLKAWFRGMKPTLEGIIPYAGVNFGTYETLKYYAPKNEEGHVPTATRLLCGGLSGAIGQTVSYPWDVVRRRMQIHGFAPGTKSLDYNGSINTMRTIVRNEGWRALYRGITINYFKVTPTVAISFTVYELSKNWIAGHTQRTK